MAASSSSADVNLPCSILGAVTTTPHGGRRRSNIPIQHNLVVDAIMSGCPDLRPSWPGPGLSSCRRGLVDHCNQRGTQLGARCATPGQLAPEPRALQAEELPQSRAGWGPIPELLLLACVHSDKYSYLILIDHISRVLFLFLSALLHTHTRPLAAPGLSLISSGQGRGKAGPGYTPLIHGDVHILFTLDPLLYIIQFIN